jgi:hypothetical protein
MAWGERQLNRCCVCAGCRGEGGFTVQERGSLALTHMLLQSAIHVLAGGSASLSGCTLVASASLAASGGGSLSLASMAMPAAVLSNAMGTLTGVGSTLRLDTVTVLEAPDAVSGIMTIASGSDSPKAFGRSNPFGGTFAVASGPCTVSNGGRCVGRPAGYEGDEHCAITVSGGGGVLGPCAVFDTEAHATGNDRVTLPGEDREYRGGHDGSDCPMGAALAPGDAITWQSDLAVQGTVGCESWAAVGCGNGCAAKGTCGLPFNSDDGLGADGSCASPKRHNRNSALFVCVH